MITAFILIMTKPGREKTVQERLQAMPNIEEAHTIYGDYDLIAKLTVASIEEMNDVILKQIRSIPDISSTTTLIGI